MSDPREGAVTEAQVQRDVVRNLKLLGFAVWRVGQYNARRTQDAGVPDIIAMHERYGLAFVEVKRPKGGRLSVPQEQFRTVCQAARVKYVVARDTREALLGVMGAT